jgi:hypothetical protein
MPSSADFSQSLFVTPWSVTWIPVPSMCQSIDVKMSITRFTANCWAARFSRQISSFFLIFQLNLGGVFQRRRSYLEASSNDDAFIWRRLQTTTLLFGGVIRRRHDKLIFIAVFSHCFCLTLECNANLRSALEYEDMKISITIFTANNGPHLEASSNNAILSWFSSTPFSSHSECNANSRYMLNKDMEMLLDLVLFNVIQYTVFEDISGRRATVKKF